MSTHTHPLGRFGWNSKDTRCDNTSRASSTGLLIALPSGAMALTEVSRRYATVVLHERDGGFGKSPPYRLRPHALTAVDKVQSACNQVNETRRITEVSP